MNKICWLLLFVATNSWGISSVSSGAHVSGAHVSGARVSGARVSGAHASSSSSRSTAARSVARTIPFIFIPGAHHIGHHSTYAHDPSYWYYLNKCLRENKNEECER